MQPLVSLRVGVEGCAQQRQSNGCAGVARGIRRPADVVTVGGIIGNRHAITRFTDVYPAVRDGLKASGIPGRVGVSGPEDMAELNLGGRPIGVQIERKGELQQLLAFVPVDAEGELHRRRIRRQGDLLDQLRGPEGTRDPHSHGSIRTVDDLNGVCAGKVGDRVPVIRVDVPGVPSGRGVPMQLKHVSAGTRWNELPIGRQVAHRREEPVAVNRDGDQGVE